MATGAASSHPQPQAETEGASWEWHVALETSESTPSDMFSIKATPPQASPNAAIKWVLNIQVWETGDSHSNHHSGGDTLSQKMCKIKKKKPFDYTDV